MTKTLNRTTSKKRFKVNKAPKAPAKTLAVSAPHHSPLEQEAAPMDISKMDHASGLSGMPPQAGQK